MKISVITVCYNSQATIRDTIESVLSQDYSNVEYVIVDGGSSDSTLQIISEYSSRIAIIISEPDKGIYDALNKGLNVATGDFVGFMHSDDTYADSGVLSRIAESAAGFDAVYGDLDYVSQNDSEKVIRHWRSRDYDTRLLKQGWMPAHPTLYIRRNIYEELGGFDLSFKIAADYDSILRYFSQPGFRARYLPETLVKMKLGGISNGSLKGIVQKTKEDMKALQKNGVSFPWLVIALKNISKVKQFLR